MIPLPTGSTTTAISQKGRTPACSPPVVGVALIELGFGPEYRNEVGSTFSTVESHVRFLREIPPDHGVVVQPVVIGVDTNRLHLAEVMLVRDQHLEAATFESMLLHVDMTTTRVSSIPDWFRTRAESMVVRPAPDFIGRSVQSI